MYLCQKLIKVLDMKNKYKLAVFDIDGVLNAHGGNILPESVAAIYLLRSKGIRVCFASGKHAWYVHGGLVWSGILDDTTYIVAENGGVIYDPYSRRTLLEEGHINDVNLLRAIYRNLQSRSEGYTTFAGIRVWEEPKETLFCLFPEKPEDVPQLATHLKELVEINGLRLSVVENPDSVDVLQQGISKATGLKYICDWLKLDFEEIMAFGDSYNDVEMLSAVGLPITVANGVETVKNIVKVRSGYVAHDKYGIGVLEAVNHLIQTKVIPD